MQLVYKTYGKGPAFFFIHGFLGSGDNWTTIAKKFSEDFQVVLPDMRNHGRSFHEDEFSYELMAEDLKRLMDTLEIESAIVLGHSMGGKIAMKFALEYPSYCRALISVDSRPAAFDGGHEKFLDALDSMKENTAKSRSELDKLLSKRVGDWGLRQFLLKNFRRLDGGFELKVNIDALRSNYSNILASIESEESTTVPALFLKAEKSAYITEEHEGEIQRLFPNARIEGIDSGHWIHAEKPNELISAINQFITRLK